MKWILALRNVSYLSKLFFKAEFISLAFKFYFYAFLFYSMWNVLGSPTFNAAMVIFARFFSFNFSCFGWFHLNFFYLYFSTKYFYSRSSKAGIISESFSLRLKSLSWASPLLMDSSEDNFLHLFFVKFESQSEKLSEIKQPLVESAYELQFYFWIQLLQQTYWIKV